VKLGCIDEAILSIKLIIQGSKQGKWSMQGLKKKEKRKKIKSPLKNNSRDSRTK